MIALLPVESAVVANQLDQFERFVSMRFHQPGVLKRMVDEGWIKLANITANGEPKYLLGYHLTDDGGLWVDMMRTLAAGGTEALIWSGLDCLAKEMRCVYIRFATQRRGIVAAAQSHGFKPDAVLMTKEVR